MAAVFETQKKELESQTKDIEEMIQLLKQMEENDKILIKGMMLGFKAKNNEATKAS